jgi:hypothetical protein
MRGRNRTFRGHSLSPDYIRTPEFTVTAVLLFESRGIKEHDVPGGSERRLHHHNWKKTEKPETVL